MTESRGKKRKSENESNATTSNKVSRTAGDLVDIGAARAQSTQRVSKAAQVHWDDYMKFAKLPFASYEDMSLGDFTQDLFGKFVDYLITIKELQSSGTVLDYLSAMKTKIIKDHPNTVIFVKDGWYTYTRRNTKKIYLEELYNVTKVKPTNTGTTMTEAHHDYIGLALFMADNVQSITDRALLALNWSCLGKYYIVVLL